MKSVQSELRLIESDSKSDVSELTSGEYEVGSDESELKSALFFMKRL